MGTQREAAIQNLIGMGFDRPSVEAAMRAAYYNADRAVEYLMDGIPESVQREVAASGSQRHAPAAPAGASQDAPTTAGADDSGNVNLFEAAAQAERSGNAGAGAGALGADAPPGGLGNLDWLRSNPQFQQLRQVVQQQPQMLEPILQSVGAGNPQLAQLIGQNPNEFLQLLGERAEDGDVLLPPGATSISVTPEEQQAIDRVSSFLPTLCLRRFANWSSSSVLASIVIWLSRPTSHATRTRSLRLTFSSTSQMMRTTTESGNSG
jgi:UV excision repair protein RAD23